jgi:hypothetical protein
MSSSETTNSPVAEQVADKGKGKAPELVETEDESSDEEMPAGDVCLYPFTRTFIN